MIPGPGQVAGRTELGTPVEEGAAVPFPGALQGPLSRWLGTPLWAFQPTGMLTARLHWVGVSGEKQERKEEESAERAPSRRDSQAAEALRRPNRGGHQARFPGRKKGHRVSWQRTPQHNYTPTGTGVSGQRTPQKYNTPRETGVSGYMTPQEAVRRRTGMSSQGTPSTRLPAEGRGCWAMHTPRNQQARGLGCQVKGHPTRPQAEGDWGVKSMTPQPDYSLRETGVSGQEDPEGPTLPKLMDIPTLPHPGCPIRTDIQPHMFWAEVFGTTRPNQGLPSSIRVAATQAGTGLMLVGGEFRGFGHPWNRLEITRPHIIAGSPGPDGGVCWEGGRTSSPITKQRRQPSWSPIDWRVQAHNGGVGRQGGCV
ncbi:murA [Mytilus edulis]|uniref:MurA n=1 Tax=Mytilus edulis TaxID=6550 RepID=A0A8S3TWT5_MYTED|nr:murA [Mytilus edulis]